MRSCGEGRPEDPCSKVFYNSLFWEEVCVEVWEQVCGEVCVSHLGSLEQLKVPVRMPN